MEAITKKTFNIDDYHRMAEVGIIRPDDRVELINGEIIEMSPIGNEHLGIVSRINMLLAPRLAGKYIVHVQSPVKIGNHSEPEPDLTVTPHRDDYYAGTGVSPSDVLLLIEVSDTTLKKDVQLKLPLYAQANIPEVWIVDLQNEQVIQYTDPENSVYQQNARRGNVWQRQDTFSATQLSLKVAGSDILG
jgi:Uma2 family endonuclease